MRTSHTHVRRTRTRAILILLFLCLATCSRQAPLIQILPPSHHTPESPSSPPSAQIIEARPNGLMITMRAPETTREPWARASILRQRDDEPPVVMHALTPNTAEREALMTRGLTLLDGNLEEAHRYTYVTTLHDEQDQLVWVGEPTQIIWSAPPPPPHAFGVSPVGSIATRLTWRPRPGWGVLVLRRKLGDTDQAMQRHAFIPEDEVDTHVDRGVQPGQGYVYRVAHARAIDPRSNAAMVLGLPGAEVYVVLPER